MSEKFKTALFLLALFVMFVAGNVAANLIKESLGW